LIGAAEIRDDRPLGMNESEDVSIGPAHGPQLDLRGRVAVVTGASRGIGRAVALDLARHGASVVCGARDAERLAATWDAIVERGGRAVALSVDVRDDESVEGFAADSVDAFGRVDILVNNAGVAYVEDFDVASLRTWNDVLTTNLTGAFLTIKHLLEPLSASPFAAIVNVGSVNGIAAMKRLSAYCAAKAALHHLTRQLALELADRGIRVNCVAPGFIATDMFEASHSEARQQTIRRLHAMRRVGAPEEVAYGVSFLVSDLASFITGSVLSIDGGLSTHFGLDMDGHETEVGDQVPRTPLAGGLGG
jgi:3-oxoacyl-[acyl-carrier protein] reductase